MILDNIYSDIVASFGQLWSCKHRGNTLEIITPVSTLSNKFVSVFITEREEGIVVTDGGWIDNEFYDCDIKSLHGVECFEKQFNYFIASYQIKQIEDFKGTQVFYLKSKEAIAIPALVHSVSLFICSVVNAALVPYVDEKAINEKEKATFKQEADAFLKQIVKRDAIVERNVSFNKFLLNKPKTLKFSAIITDRNQLSLVSYISGYNNDYFLSSLAKSTVNIELAATSPLQKFIKRKIGLINDLSKGFNSAKHFPYILLLERQAESPVVLWSEKHKLIDLLN